MAAAQPAVVNMAVSGENMLHILQHVVGGIPHYQVYPVPMQRPDVRINEEAGPSPAVKPENAMEEGHEYCEEDEALDRDLEMLLSREPPPPVPTQLAKFHHQLKVGCFVATIEVLMDRGGQHDIKKIQRYALRKAEKLIRSTGEEILPEDPERPICGTPKIKRDLKRMAKHIDYFNGLLSKFVEEFDGSQIRVNKLRRATGYIKGILARDGQPVYNICEKPRITEFNDMLDIFKVNGILFIEYLKSWQE